MKKNNWHLLLFMLSGLVIGGLLGSYLGEMPYLGFLNYGQSFGLTSPLVLDLSIAKLTFGLVLNITVCGVLGLLIGVFAYRKL